MRDVHCDFCNVVLTDHGWDCPARDIDYDEPRTRLGGGDVVDGSIGSWLACDECAACVRNGDRETLVARAVIANYGPSEPLPSFRFKIPRRLLVDLRDLHDQFWSHREGEPVRIDAGQITLIASDPATVREPR
jgi:hypothetical protein